MELTTIRYRLLATASVLAFGAAGPARAELNIDPSGFWVSTGGAYLTDSGTLQPLLKSGAGLSPQSDRVRNSWMAQLAMGGPLGDLLPNWDFRLAYTGIRSEAHRLSAHGAPGATLTLPTGNHFTVSHSPTFNSSIKQGFDIGDFDVGHDIGLGLDDLTTRAFVGGRIVSFNQSSRASLLGGEGATELSCSHFFGVGPHIGLSSSYRIGRFAGLDFDLTGDIDGAALFGWTYHKATVTSIGTESPVTLGEGTNSEPANAFNADVSGGLKIALPVDGHECALTLGYMAQAWIGVVNTHTKNFTLAGSAGTFGGNQYLHGPFLDLSATW